MICLLIINIISNIGHRWKKRQENKNDQRKWISMMTWHDDSVMSLCYCCFPICFLSFWSSIFFQMIPNELSIFVLFFLISHWFVIDSGPKIELNHHRWNNFGNKSIKFGNFSETNQIRNTMLLLLLCNMMMIELKLVTITIGYLSDMSFVKMVFFSWSIFLFVSPPIKWK